MPGVVHGARRGQVWISGRVSSGPPSRPRPGAAALSSWMVWSSSDSEGRSLKVLSSRPRASRERGGRVQGRPPGSAGLASGQAFFGSAVRQVCHRRALREPHCSGPHLPLLQATARCGERGCAERAADMPLSSRLANWPSPTESTEGVAPCSSVWPLTALGRTRQPEPLYGGSASQGPGDCLQGLPDWAPGLPEQQLCTSSPLGAATPALGGSRVLGTLTAHYHLRGQWCPSQACWEARGP